jgi:chemotaxis signal transduction protein
VSPDTNAFDERLLTFEIAGSLFAMPIAGVLEVAERSGTACIPTVSQDIAFVMNYRGDALTVVRRERLLPVSAPSQDGPDEAEHVLVVTDRRSPVPRFGLDVDRVLGLAEGTCPPSRDGSVIAERRPLDGRLASILDPTRLVARAREVVEGSFEAAG